MWDQLETNIKLWMKGEDLDRTDPWCRGYLLGLRMVLEEMKRIESEAEIKDVFP